MDSVVTSLLVMPGSGQIEEQAGSYSDWEARGGQIAESSLMKHSPSQTPSTEPDNSVKPTQTVPTAATKKKRKLSYQEQRELNGLPAEIEALEQQHAALLAAISAPGFYEQTPELVATTLTTVTESEQALDHALERLVALEG
jgi:ATP-binding cassette subfamily F protein uup